MSQRIVSFEILFKDNIIEKVEGTTAELLSGKRIVCQARIHDKCIWCKVIFGICVVYMVTLSLLNIFIRKDQKNIIVSWNVP